MPSDATTARPATEAPLSRFDGAERIVHWSTAGLMIVLMLTGAALYAGPLSTVVGNRETVRNVHVWSGLLLFVPLLLTVAMRRRGARLRNDLGRLNRWAPGERRWFRRRTRDEVQLGKFNPGQKLNAACIGGAGLVMLATGSIMHWFSAFPVDWRTGATFVHDWFSFAIWVLVLGHVLFAIRDGDALEAMMVNGRVPASWARRKAPRWYAEVRGDAALDPTTRDAARDSGA
ncbi:MAG: cytochrome b/b6 domain-containing protein [Acidimicrobiia bacterium]